MEFLQTALKVLGVIFALLVVAVLLTGFLLTWSTQNGDLQKQFLQGKMPAVLPDGPYRGTVDGFAGNWRGKEFSRSKQGGWNLFSVGQGTEAKFPFRMYRSKGLRDKDFDVLKIDYNLAQNPAWLRMVTDEIVDSGSGAFLGKVHLRLLPGYPFALGFFRLYKQ